MIMEQHNMDSSGSTSDRSSNLSCSPPPPKSTITPPSTGGQSSPGLTGGSRVSQNSPIMGPHQLSPPHISTPNSLPPHHRFSHSGIPPLPPSLGLLNSLSNMVHHSPLDLMSVSHHHMPPRSYNSPPPISSSDPTANECKLVDYRGQKVAAFIIAGDTMLCLPQAFELFLKHLVGGLHTVYTKLKRLDIVPLVCNVEQVRILRGLGAIQPGVNRCKLLSCKDFDILYRDCTTASSRPGRPPKRASSVGLSIAASHLSQLKKHRENGDYLGAYENGHLTAADAARLEKSPLLANGYNHPPTHLNHMQQFMQFNHHHPAAAAAALLNHPGLPSSHPGMPRLPHDASSLLKGQPLPPGTMDVLTRSGIWEDCRAAYEGIVKHLERLREERIDADRVLSLENKARDLSSHNGSSNGHSPVLNLSKNGADHSGSDGEHTPHDDVDDDADSITDNDDEDDKDLSDAGDIGGVSSSRAGSESPGQRGAINYSGSALVVGDSTNVNSTNLNSNSGSQDAVISSTETLLRNIQGLLKVAADNARQQERQISYEKAELKLDVLREREVKENLERQLINEQKMRELYEKRFKKERKTRKRVQEHLEMELKRRNQLEDAIKTSCANTDALRGASGGEHASANEREREKDKDTSKERERNERTANDHSNSSTYSNPTTAHQHSQPQELANNDKPWNYSNIDIINTGAAFWQNYSETLAQELELERKSRQHQQLQQQTQHGDRTDSKSPLQDSRNASNYYKNSVLFSTAT